MSAATPLPLARTCPFSPVTEHVQLRQDEPSARVTLPSGSQAWVLTRHDDIRTMLADPRLNANRTLPGIPQLTDRPKARLGSSLITVDSPEHRRRRREVAGEFTVKRAAALELRIQQAVDDRIDAMLDGPRPADLVQALALPVPSVVICELLGVPYEDHEFFQNHSSALLRLTAPDEEKKAAAVELLRYMEALVAKKAREPGDDLLSRHLEKTGDRTGAAGLGFLLLIAGHETTSNMISLGTMMLLRRPETVAAIRSDPAKTPGAVEELMRYFTVAEYAVVRVADEDAEIGGVTIRAGEGVLALSNTANRDPAAFEAPDEFDIERDSRNHLGFGYGAHQCLGQNLARAELRIVFDTLFRRLPGLRLTRPAEELPFKADGNVYGLYELPVTW
ncbi:cytochrome P450 [Streptomyces sp. NPDC090798]|uniref:cytochrome P450 n=1 Tax=Streptomyces sp. NPDC090798 TaxID=3365968 RepID=UPI00381122ED